MKKCVLFLLLSFLFINCSALTYKGCDYSSVAKMKELVKNINISYDYRIVNNEAVFDITVNNLTNEIYFYDEYNKKNYYYSDTVLGEITISGYKIKSGSYKFYSNNADCIGIVLGTKYYNLPEYNRFFGSELCKKNSNYSLCQKWTPVNYSQQEFEDLIDIYNQKEETKENEKIIVEYEKSFIDRVVEFYIDYYYYLYGVLILASLIIIYIYNRKNRFDL